MPAKRSIKGTASPTSRPAPPSDSVDALLSMLVHPCKREIVALRDAVLAAHPSISEGVKWNAPSFRTTDWFATIHLRARDGVQMILHFGARTPAAIQAGVSIDDPAELLRWLGPDRATIVFRDMTELAAKRAALQALLRDWIAHVDT